MAKHKGRRKVWGNLKNSEAAKEFGIYYYKFASDDEYVAKQDTSGSTSSLERAYKLAAGHCAAAELAKNEYAKAVVFNRWKGHMLRSYTLYPGKSIQIKEY